MGVAEVKMKWHPVRLRKYHVMVVVFLLGLATSRHCDHHHYWDSKSRVCQPCAKCPLNEIIRKPCGRHTNTVCGPFREFNYFNQLRDFETSYTSYEYESAFGENSSGVDKGGEVPHKTDGEEHEPIVQKDDGEYWKNLAFALIGVVCVLIFVATVVVLMACRKLHESAAVKQSEEEEDDDSGYVVIRSIRPPLQAALPVAANFSSTSAARALLAPDSNMSPPLDTSQLTHRQELSSKGMYTPTRRLLNYDADDVFESEDSAGSRTSRRAPQLLVLEGACSLDNEHVKISASDQVSV